MFFFAGGMSAGNDDLRLTVNGLEDVTAAAAGVVGGVSGLLRMEFALLSIDGDTWVIGAVGSILTLKSLARCRRFFNRCLTHQLSCLEIHSSTSASDLSKHAFFMMSLFRAVTCRWTFGSLRITVATKVLISDSLAAVCRVTHS